MTAPKKFRFGSYTIGAPLGEGGMCLVFRARKDGASEDVALKLLRTELNADARIRDSFVTEADLSLLLDHPNLVRAYEAGEVEGRHFIAMELIEGAALSELVERLSEHGIVLPPDLAIYTASEVLAGLAALHETKSPAGHELGLVHRDVSAHNVFVDFGGRTILGDLGIAHIRAHGATDPGRAAGKIEYLPPEVIQGQTPDRRADLYALGVMLFFLLVGEAPYSYPADASDEVILISIRDGKLKRPRKIRPSLPRGLEDVLLSTLAKKPEDRPADARALSKALEPFLSPLLASPNILSGVMRGVFRERVANLGRESSS